MGLQVVRTKPKQIVPAVGITSNRTLGPPLYIYVEVKRIMGPHACTANTNPLPLVLALVGPDAVALLGPRIPAVGVRSVHPVTKRAQHKSDSVSESAPDCCEQATCPLSSMTRLSRGKCSWAAGCRRVQPSSTARSAPSSWHPEVAASGHCISLNSSNSVELPSHQLCNYRVVAARIEPS